MVETIFDQYEKYDGDTMERVWQSLFKVYDQTLRLMGDNDFKVEHTGVSRRQRAGTLERVVKYDQEAFTQAGTIWQRARVMTRTTKKYIFFQLFFVFGAFLPLEKGRNKAILGPIDFFSDARTCCVVREEPPPNGIRLKKHHKIQKNHRLWDQTHEMVCVIIADFTSGTEEV